MPLLVDSEIVPDNEVVTFGITDEMRESYCAWFINKFGPHVNLGNIGCKDVLSLECLRRGMRADTFSNFLNIK